MQLIQFLQLRYWTGIQGVFSFQDQIWRCTFASKLTPLWFFSSWEAQPITWCCHLFLPRLFKLPNSTRQKCLLLDSDFREFQTQLFLFLLVKQVEIKLKQTDRKGCMKAQGLPFCVCLYNTQFYKVMIFLWAFQTLPKQK